MILARAASAVKVGPTPSEFAQWANVSPFLVRSMIVALAVALRHDWGRPVLVAIDGGEGGR